MTWIQVRLVTNLMILDMTKLKKNCNLTLRPQTCDFTLNKPFDLKMVDILCSIQRLKCIETIYGSHLLNQLLSIQFISSKSALTQPDLLCFNQSISIHSGCRREPWKPSNKTTKINCNIQTVHVQNNRWKQQLKLLLTFEVAQVPWNLCFLLKW